MEDSAAHIKSRSCEICGKNDFTSRNKLFRHLKFCGLDLKGSMTEDINGSTAKEQLDCYIYVAGGRLRGKTLGFQVHP